MRASPVSPLDRSNGRGYRPRRSATALHPRGTAGPPTAAGLSAPPPSVRDHVEDPPAPSYQCSECGWTSAKWVGRCGECQAWGSVAEARPPRRPRAEAGPGDQRRACRSPRSRSRPRRSAAAACPSSTGCSAAAWCPGAAILLAGEPGVGKSTLLLEVAAQTARYQRRTLYVTGEESASQVRLRADRTGGVHDELYLAAETDLGAILTHVEQVRPEVLVVDSIQTIGAAEPRRRARRRHPGQGGRGRADPGGQDPQHHHDHRRPRHQGRLDRRPAGARARRRRGAPLRGRPQLPVPDGPRPEEPLRPGRRGRLLRPRPPTASPRSPTRPASSWRTTSHACPAPASR